MQQYTLVHTWHTRNMRGAHSRGDCLLGLLPAVVVRCAVAGAVGGPHLEPHLLGAGGVEQGSTARRQARQQGVSASREPSNSQSQGCCGDALEQPEKLAKMQVCIA